MISTDSEDRCEIEANGSGEILRLHSLMAFKATGFLPSIVDINRMLEFKSRAGGISLNRIVSALHHDRVASFAVMTDFDPCLGLMGSVVAAHAASVVKVPDVVGIGGPASFHVRENVLRKCLLSAGDCSGDLVGSDGLTIGLVVSRNSFGNSGGGGIFRAILGRQCFDRHCFYSRQRLVNYATFNNAVDGVVG